MLLPRRSLALLLALGLVCGAVNGAVTKKKATNEAVTKGKVSSVKSPADVKSESGASKPSKTVGVPSFAVDEVPFEAVVVPVIPSSVVGDVTDDSAFLIAQGGAEGSILQPDLGLEGAGVAQGLAGGFISPAGAAGGGTGSANAQIGFSTRPLSAFIGVSGSGTGGFNNVPGSGPLGFLLQANTETLSEKGNETSGGPVVPGVPDVPTLPDLPSLPLPQLPLTPQAPLFPNLGPDSEATRPVPASIAADPSAPSPGLFALFRPITQALSSAPPSPTGLFSLFRPISVPSFVANSPLLSAIDLSPPAEAAGAEEEEEGGLLYSLVRPLTPSAIGSNVLAFFKPLTQFAGQADGTITFTGGITFNGFELPWNKPEGVPSKPFPPPTCSPEVETCIGLCARAGKTGGTLTAGTCCTCTCPVPESPPGDLCCSGTDARCHKFCTQNKYYQYASGTCNQDKTCECACKVSEPCFGEVPYPFYAQALMEKRKRKQ